MELYCVNFCFSHLVINPLTPVSPIEPPLTVNDICANEKKAPNLFAKLLPALLWLPTKSSKEKLKIFSLNSTALYRY